MSALLSYQPDVMIVLGRVDDNGRLTKDAHERIRYASVRYRETKPRVVVAPARWSYKLKRPPAETEARTIQRLLTARGIPEKAIVLEEKSCDTLGGAYFLKTDVVLPRSFRSVLVITSEDHLDRTRYVFEKVFGYDYDIRYEYGDRVLSDEEFEASMLRERQSLQLMDETWIGPIVPGRHEMVLDVFAKHPGYNPSARLSSDEIEQRIRSQAVTTIAR